MDRRVTLGGAFFAGACALLVGFLLGGGGVQRALAAPATEGPVEGYLAVTGSLHGENLLYVVDSRRQRVLVYEATRAGLRFHAVRSFEHDVVSPDWQSEGRAPTVRQVKEEVGR